MAETPQPTDAMFPALGEAQIERLATFGTRRQAQPGEILFDRGDNQHAVFIVSALDYRNPPRTAFQTAATDTDCPPITVL